MVLAFFTNHIIQDICPAIRYKCIPISDGENVGSCEHYKERKLIPYDVIKDLSLEDVHARLVLEHIYLAF